MGGDSILAANAGLPEITGSFHIMRAGPSSFEGAFCGNSGSQGWGVGNNDVMTEGNVYFKASRSSNIYGASNTVQPPALSLLPQIKF